MGMDTTLIVNPGSSSKKYAFYSEGVLRLVVKYEKTSEGYGQCVRINTEQQKCEDVSDLVYSEALQGAIDVAIEAEVLTEEKRITKVGVRIVAPGTYFREHRAIDKEMIEKLKEVESVVPLHIPPILEEIAAVQNALPEIPMTGVSDSAFHVTIPAYIRRYSLKGAEERGIEKFGYHGLSVASIARRLENMFGSVPEKVIVAHVGNGVSVTALKNGESVDTTMGYTPASGLLMGSRAGDIDPGALITVLEAEGLSGADAQRYIQKEGGFMGLLGVTDIRTVMERVAQGDEAAKDAMNAFVLNIQKAVAAAAVTLGGVDSIVLTATAMERNPDLRKRILSGLEFLGVEVNDDVNEQVLGRMEVVSAEGSRVMVSVIPTDEMGEIARNSIN